MIHRVILASLLLAPVCAAGAQPMRSAPADAAPATGFTRDPAAFEAKQNQMVAALRQRSPQAAAELEGLFRQDLLGMIAPEMRRMGLDMDDMADMTAVYWVAAWEASNGIVGRKTDPRLARGARDQIARTFAGNAGLARMSDRDKQDVADTMLLQAILVEARMQTAAANPSMRKQVSDAVHTEAGQLIKTDLRRVKLTPAGFVALPDGAGGPVKPPAGGGTAVAPAAPAAPAVPAGGAGRHAANWQKVEGVYFRSFTNFGVGGMMTQDFEPIILFRDGSYYEIEGPALEDVDLDASRRARPIKWGRWSRGGKGFVLTNSKGKANDYALQQGAFFKAFPAEAGANKLAAKYTRVSGGGNAALGGELTIAAQTDLSFSPDGSYGRASSAGAVGSGSQSGVGLGVSSRKPAAGIGRYRIERHTITLVEPDGATKRQFFAFGSRKAPAQPATSMIFIGDRVFVDMD
ncbi:DUF6683 family protein [Sphingomonas sanxanigenens]|uniref:Uncharacterized protein n=1 Tax=Sphingomonas sanxanigenens DSM 19645 = NX02 TaxID=1123269 RepID=W0A6D7_9SPHN|nr:DUF6683 family protein [Sphingomonas sanxanigenens]AHE52027.1 hypothetical protein NX02_01305 [Sphingomonas sanxanigenens DSM 19645 = NX02]